MSRYLFDRFELDSGEGILKKNGDRLPIQKQPLDLLCTLLERAPGIVTHQQIREVLWSDGVYVDFEHSIHRSIRKLRELLSDSSTSPRFIENVPRRGYRFIAPLTIEPGTQVVATGFDELPGAAVRFPEPDIPPTASPARRRSTGRFLSFISAIAILVTLGLAGWVLEVRGTGHAIFRHAAEEGNSSSRLSQTRRGAVSNQEAYDLLLRSRALPHDGEANEQAIAVLERAVGLEDDSSELWQTLASRYRYSYEYNRGGPLQYRKAEAAYKKALSIDPALISAATDLIEMRAENGDLNPAFDEARVLLKRARDNASAHFAMSYVLRYAGLLSESAEQCNEALRISPRDHELRTCGQTFIRLHNYARAEEFIRLDAGTDWSEGMELLSLIKGGKTSEALISTSPIKGMAAPLLRACAEHRPIAEVRSLAVAEERFPIADPEPRYHVAMIDAYCGLRDRASTLLLEAVSTGYCAVPDLESDPWLRTLAHDSKFSEIVARANACQQAFLTHREARER